MAVARFGEDRARIAPNRLSHQLLDVTINVPWNSSSHQRPEPHALRGQSGSRHQQGNRAPDVNLIFGDVIDPSLGDTAHHVIATGFDRTEIRPH